MYKKLILILLLIIPFVFYFAQGEDLDLRQAYFPRRDLVEIETKRPNNDYVIFDDSESKPIKVRDDATLISVGDIMGHTLQLKAAKTSDGYDFAPQLEHISSAISSRDLAIANLETVFAGKERRYSGANMIFNTPDNLAQSIKDAGFDILTTANNHTLDRGFSGVERTLDLLDELEIDHTGSYRNQEESQEILVKEVNGISFAFLSYSYSTNGWPIPEEHPYAINMIDEAKIIEDIHKAKALADFVIIGVHWGLEYHLNENHHQSDLAKIMFYEGADIILGTHPHVLQPFEHMEMVDRSGVNKDKFIIYSQGNFLSGQRTYPRAIGMYITYKFTRIGLGDPFVSEVAVMPTYVEALNGEMRVLDTLQAQDAMVATSKEKLDEYKSTFLDHIASRVDMLPYLNNENAYVIYEIK